MSNSKASRNVSLYLTAGGALLAVGVGAAYYIYQQMSQEKK